MTPWSMFVLEKTHPHDLYKELTLMVEGNEYSNPAAYVQVISEAHIWLRSEMNYFSSSDEDSRKLLTESSIKMAQFLARYLVIHDYHLLLHKISQANITIFSFSVKNQFHSKNREFDY